MYIGLYINKILRYLPSSRSGKWLFSFPVFLFPTLFSIGVSQENGIYQEGKVYVRFVEGKVNTPKSADRQVPVELLFPQSKSGLNTSVFGLHEFAFSMHLNQNPILARSFQLSFDSVDKIDDLMHRLENDPRVELVERVPLDRPCVLLPTSRKGVSSSEIEDDVMENTLPDDPFYGTSEGLNYSWNLDMIGFKEIYGKYKASPDVKVGVVDAAIWGDHEDLGILPSDMMDVANVQPSSNPPSFVDQNEQGSPDNLSLALLWSHGTHCAGILAAKTDNGKGIASLASGVTLLAARTAKDNPNELTNNPDGILWAIAKGAKVLSLSYITYAYSETQREMYESAVRDGVIIIAAAGNDASTTQSYPACYEGVISVGSLDSDGSRSSFSNYGDWVDVWAPGGYVRNNGQIVEDNQILSTTYGVTNYYANRDDLKGKYYDAMSGTSMATPLVASMVSLAVSYYPEMTPADALVALKNSVKGSTVYAPAMMEYLEKNNPNKLVRQPQGVWNPFTMKADLSWESPVEEGVTSYLVSKDGVFVGNTEDTTYVLEVENKDVKVEVSAVYGTDTAGAKQIPLVIDSVIVSLVVNEPIAVWYPSTQQADFKWKAPEKGDADRYVIFAAGEEFASTSELTYTGKVEDTSVSYTIMAIFGKDSSYALPFVFEVGTSNECRGTLAPTFDINVQVDRISKTVTLFCDKTIEQLDVFTVQGVEVFHLQADVREFRMPDVPGGIYVLRVLSQGEVRTVKFVL